MATWLELAPDISDKALATARQLRAIMKCDGAAEMGFPSSSFPGHYWRLRSGRLKPELFAIGEF